MGRTVQSFQMKEQCQRLGMQLKVAQKWTNEMLNTVD